METNSKISFDLKEIKADAQWLSEKAKIDEITALRIVVLEWQGRPATRLAKGFSSEEATSVQSATGADNLGISVAGPNLASVLKQTAGDNPEASFNSESDRRLRIRQTYLSERTHLLKTYRKLLALSLHHTPNQLTNDASTESNNKHSLRSLGGSIFKDKSTGTFMSKFIEDCITGIRQRLNDFAQETGWLSEPESSPETDLSWRTSLIEEVLHILQLMFHQLHVSAEVPSADLLLSWLELMAQHNFLQSYEVVSEVFLYNIYHLGRIFPENEVN